MTLDELIAALEAENPARRVPLGFTHPHSYRGDYSELAFEPIANITIGDMLAAARSAKGATYQGHKGGDYTMDGYTDCWLAEKGCGGETIGPILLAFMLAGRELGTVTQAGLSRFEAEYVRRPVSELHDLVAHGFAEAAANGGYAEVLVPPHTYWATPGEMPRGLRIAAAWLDQIRAATGREPDAATVERITRDCFRNRPCRDCGAQIGQAHEHGCDVERCTYTGMQWIACGGMTEWGDCDCDCEGPDGEEPDYAEDHTCGQVRHDCGSQVWDGVWPGYGECVEYGWFTWFGPPWRDCGPDHPQACPDLTRLLLECDWDRGKQQWVRRA